MLLFLFQVAVLPMIWRSIGAESASRADSILSQMLSSTNLTASMVEGSLGTVDAMAGLSGDEQSQLKEILNQVLAFVNSRDAFAARAKEHEEAIAAARGLLEVLGKDEGDSKNWSVPDGQNSDQLVPIQAKLEAELSTAKNRLAELEEEPTRRAGRQVEVPQQMARARELLDQIEQDLASMRPEDGKAALCVASKLLLQVRRQSRRMEIQALEKELSAYDATAALLSGQRDAQAEKVVELTRRVELVKDAIQQQRKVESAEVVRKANQQEAAYAKILEGTHPTLEQLVRQNSEYARELIELNGRIDSTSTEQESAAKRLSNIENEFRNLRERVSNNEALGGGDVGLDRQAAPKTEGLDPEDGQHEGGNS